MKTIKNLFNKFFMFALIIFTAFAVVGCGDDEDDKKEEINIHFESNTYVISETQSAYLFVSITGTENTSYTFEVSDPTLATVQNNSLSVIGTVKTNTEITVTAISNADNSVKASKKFVIIAPKLDVKVYVDANKSAIKADEELQLEVLVQNAADTSVVWSVNKEGIVAIDSNNVLRVVGEVTNDTSVVVTATSKEDPTKSASITIAILADAQAGQITFEASNTILEKGDSANLNVVVSGLTDTTYRFELSDETLFKIEGNVITAIGDSTVDRVVTVTAIANGDPKIKASKTFIFVAPVIEGQVGDLTTEMLAHIGNENITVTGVVTDYYQDFNNSMNSTINTYDMSVMMSEGAWAGSWNNSKTPNIVLTDNYRKGEIDGLKDQSGNVGHALEKLYINKNNEVAKKTVTDYLSIPAIWEAQHLWNHLSNLSIKKFEYDAYNEVYNYVIDPNNMDDLYLMTYLAYSLTPMLEDTFLTLYLVLEDGVITKLVAQTEVLYYGGTTNETGQIENPDAMSYTKLEVEFSNVGTTVVPEPTPFEAPINVDKLTTALNTMKNAENYTFNAKDVTTFAPSGDAGDYYIESTSSKKGLARPVISSKKVYDHVSSVGTVGTVGYITKEAVLFATTGKYSYSSDGNDYHTTYTGYRQMTEEYYEEFAFSRDSMSLYGKKRVYGNFHEDLPTFDFSPNVFSFDGTEMDSLGNTYYRFSLRDSNITRDIAMEISAYNYADDAEALSGQKLSLLIDINGNLVSSTYPYNITYGTYLGYCTTTYSNVGTTKLEDDLFDGYVERQVKNSWKDYMTKYYSPNFSTQNSYEEHTDVVLEAVYGDAAVDMPAPSLFLEIFGDNINGPFYNWKEKGTDADGKPINTGYISINATSSEFDENAQITNFDEIIEELRKVFTEAGFVESVANTDLTGGESGRANRYITFIKGDIQVVFENNFTKYFFIYFYKTGDWTLNR